MSANITNNNNYYNLSAQSLKLNNLDVQTQLNNLQNEIDNLTNENNWTNTNGGSVPISSGLVLTTNGIEDGAVANEQIEITENSINLNNNVNIGDNTTNYKLYLNDVDITSGSGNPNALITTTPLITPETGSIIISDGLTSTGTISTGAIKFDQDIVSINAQLDCYSSANINSGLNIQSLTAYPVSMFMDGDNNFNINNSQQSRTIFTNSSQVEFYNNVEIKDGKQLLLYNNFDVDAASIRKDNILNGDFVLANKSGSDTRFQGSNAYTFDSDLRVGDFSTSKKIFKNDVELNGVSAGMLRALNINLLVPTVEQTYDVVWSNLSPAEQAIWAGGYEPPIAGVNNSWGFQKLSAGGQKINWVLPFDFLTANLSFQDLQSVYAIIRLNTASNLSQEGYVWFQIQSQNIVPDPPLYRTRWNYANSASGVISQLGNTYKIYASDAIPLSTAASNTGKGQEPYPLQTKFKSNPVDVETSLFSIPFTKFVGSPTGDTSAGYTSAFVQSIALNTASNISSFDFSVLAIGFNNVRYNLFYA